MGSELVPAMLGSVLSNIDAVIVGEHHNKSGAICDEQCCPTKVSELSVHMASGAKCVCMPEHALLVRC